MDIDVPAIYELPEQERTICSAHPESTAVVKSMVNRRIQAAIGYSSVVTIECNDGVVTLFGHFATVKDKNNALRVAISNPCVRKVINETNEQS